MCKKKSHEKFLTTLFLLFAAHSLFALGLCGQVQEEWVARHNGSENSWDLAEAMTLDDEGNIYVSGRSRYAGDNYDIVTIKYAPNGDSLWAARFSGSTGRDDGATDIYVDDSANVYITGYCNALFTSDWVTIKYDPYGNEVWNQVLSGGSGSAIAVDNSGNVIVTGANSYPADITTIQFGPDGSLHWVRFYVPPEPGASTSGQDVVVDGDNNIYVTGSIDAGPYNPDIATIKYDMIGNLVWDSVYDAAGYPDTPYAILLDDARDVYIAGSSALTTDTNADILLLKYDNNGVELWDSRYDYGGSTDLATGMARDPDGNIIVTGGSMIPGLPGHYDYTTIKYQSEDGTELWVAQYDGPANKWDWPYGGVAVDNRGNCYVGGRSQGEGDDYDYATVAYDPDGNELWVMRYDGPANEEDYGDGGVVVDDSFNVYVTGNSEDIGTGADYTTIKYSPMLYLSVVPDTTEYHPGDLLGFTVTATNNTDSTLSFEGWTECETPWGPILSPLLGPVDMDLEGHETFSQHINQQIPFNAPLDGPYIYRTKAGTYPELVITWDQFEFFLVP